MTRQRLRVGQVVEQIRVRHHHAARLRRRRVLRRLPLRVVEISGDRHNGAVDRAAEHRLGTLAQRAQNLRRNLDRAFHARSRDEPDHSGGFLESIGKAVCVGKISQPAAHQTLDRHDGVLRIGRLVCHRRVADIDALLAVADAATTRPTTAATQRCRTAYSWESRRKRTPLVVGQYDREPVPHGGDERVGRAEIDADRALVRMWRRRLVGLGDLEQRHYFSLRKRAAAACASKLPLARSRERGKG